MINNNIQMTSTQMESAIYSTYLRNIIYKVQYINFKRTNTHLKECFICQHRHNAVKTVKSRTVSTGQKSSKSTYNCPERQVNEETHLYTLSMSCSNSKKVKVAHTRLPSASFRSWSRLLAVSLQVTWIINPTVGCHYFPPGLQLPP